MPLKIRVISSVVGLALLFAVFSLYHTVMLNIGASIVAAIAVYEMLSATGYSKHKYLLYSSMAVAVYLPLISLSWVKFVMPIVLFAYVLGLCLMLILKHKTVKTEELAVCILTAIFIPLTLTCLVLLRDTLGSYLGLYYTCIAMAAAWGSDTGAYFVGVTMGKHKLCPEISPKKTVEGLIGGLVTSMLLLPALTYGYVAVMPEAAVEINYISIVLFAPILSVLGTLGDLTASAIKRQYKIKDFGNIMPGHGGALDRFDSVLMVIPMVLIVTTYSPFITVVG